MTAAVRTGLRQGSPEWLAARRSLITATDLACILGLNRWKPEADLAAEKLNGASYDSSLPMRVGTALEDLIAAEYTRETGRAVQRMRDLVLHPRIEWAGASPDRRVVGERRLVELKYTGSRSRLADGLPQDFETQVVWSLGVLGWDAADVAVLVGGEELRVFPVEADPATFEGLVDIAADFRRRLAEGGPFAQTADSLKRAYPADNGASMVADAELEEAVTTLLAVRAAKAAAADQEEVLENAIKARMATATRLVGHGWHATWKRTKDIETVDWKSVADGLLRQLPEQERIALVGIATNVRAGGRPFRVVKESTNGD